MEKLAGYGLSALLLVAGFFSVSAQGDVVYVKNGEKLQLKPSHVSDKISISWKHEGSFVAEWIDNALPLTFYPPFKGRTTLDTTTGELEIRDMTSQDSGVFSVEINNKIQPKTHDVKVIQPVPKPKVIQPPGCNAKSERCVLRCEGNTEGAEPVSYSWNFGGEEWEKDRTRNISRQTSSIEKFSCRMKNPVSEETSEPIHNLFYSNIVVIVLVVVFSLLVLILVVVIIYKRKWILNRLFSTHGTHSLVGDVPVKPAEDADDLMTHARTDPA